MINVEKIEEGLRLLLKPQAPDGEACAASLYRYASGEASAEESRDFDKHLSICSVCRRDLAALRSIKDEMQPHTSRILIFTTAAATILAMVMIGFLLLPGGKEPSAIYRIKGASKMQVAVQRANRGFVASSGDRFAEGDVLGFFYTSPSPTFLMILFADEQGNTTLIYPSGKAVLLPKGVEQSLPDGAVLEAGVGCEWIVAFFSVEIKEEEYLKKLLKEAIKSHGPECQLELEVAQDTSVDVLVMKRDKQ